MSAIHLDLTVITMLSGSDSFSWILIRVSLAFCIIFPAMSFISYWDIILGSILKQSIGVG